MADVEKSSDTRIVVRPRKYYRNLGFLAVLLFLSGTVVGLWPNTFSDEQIGGRVFVVLVSFIMTGLGIYLILYYFRADLEINGSVLTQHNVFSTKSLNLNNVDAIDYQRNPDRHVKQFNFVLFSKNQRLRIELNAYGESDLRKLLDALKSRIPESAALSVNGQQYPT